MRRVRAESILVQFGRKGLTDRLTDAGVRSAVDQTLVIACGHEQPVAHKS